MALICSHGPRTAPRALPHGFKEMTFVRSYAKTVNGRMCRVEVRELHGIKVQAVYPMPTKFA